MIESDLKKETCEIRTVLLTKNLTVKRIGFGNKDKLTTKIKRQMLPGHAHHNPIQP